MKAQVTNNWWTILLNLIVLSVAVAILSACGGGGGGGGTASGVSSGEIEGFGSVIINGVKFEVEGAEVETEHGVTTTITSATQEDHLHLGMHVEVEVEFNNDGQTGTATRIVIDDEVEGLVSNASATGADVRTFEVLGQNVIAIAGVTGVFDENAPLSNPDIDSIANNDFVEVHGFPDGNGNIQASFIKIEDLSDGTDDNLDEITGTIDTGSLTGTNFSINGQDIDYASVPALVDGPLAEGTLVEVKGTLSAGTLVADTVHVEDGLGDNVAKVEVEGLIRDLDTAADTFTLNGQAVQYSASTEFFGVSDPADPELDLRNGLKVEAEGPIVNSVLQASKIKLKSDFRYEGVATDNSNGTWSVSIPGGGSLTIVIDASTDVEAGANPANGVKIRARYMGSSKLFATRVDDGGPNDRQIFEAPVTEYDEAADRVALLESDGDPATVDGLIEVDTSLMEENLPLNSGVDDSDFEIEDQEVTRLTFYNALHVGDTVKARHRSGNWDSIEIELDD